MKYKIITFTIILILLSSCSNQQIPQVADIDVPDEELNTLINLSVPVGWNNFKYGEAIAIRIINVSNDTIHFDPHYGVRIFWFQDERGWVEVKDKLIRLSDENIILVPYKTGTEETRMTAVLPDIANGEKKMMLRIFVFGHIYSNNDDQGNKVGAYIDVELEP